MSNISQKIKVHVAFHQNQVNILNPRYVICLLVDDICMDVGLLAFRVRELKLQHRKSMFNSLDNFSIAQNHQRSGSLTELLMKRELRFAT